MSEPIRCFMVVRAEELREENTPSPWRRPDTGEVFARTMDLPPGAIWEAPWMGEPYRVNGDGPVLVVKLPNGHEWMPGSIAKNCPQKSEPHDCWCVHGIAPYLTVNKEPKPGRTTCAAGAGSIHSGRGSETWHGFVTNGLLVGA